MLVLAQYTQSHDGFSSNILQTKVSQQAYFSSANVINLSNQ